MVVIELEGSSLRENSLEQGFNHRFVIVDFFEFYLLDTSSLRELWKTVAYSKESLQLLNEKIRFKLQLI